MDPGKSGRGDSRVAPSVLARSDPGLRKFDSAEPGPVPQESPWYPQRVSTAPLLITGSNGHLGRDLIRSLGADRPIRGVVRSERAAKSLDDLRQADGNRLEVRIADYRDEAALAVAGEGCGAWVHLVGILKESKNARYEDAHESTCEVLARAASKAGADRIVYMSILGSRVDSSNKCLASKARAEAILLSGETPTTVLRVPMVLGPHELAAMGLRSQASAPISFLTGGGSSMEQPIDARDLVRAIGAAAYEETEASGGLNLAGPESLSHRELVSRIAKILGTSPRFVPIPGGLVRGLAGAFETFMAEPPLTRAMLGVLEHDDVIDSGPTCSRLGLDLTPLESTLQHVFGPAAVE